MRASASRPLTVFYRLLLCRGFGNRLVQFVFGSYGKNTKNQSGWLITGWSEGRALHGPPPPRSELLSSRRGCGWANKNARSRPALAASRRLRATSCFRELQDVALTGAVAAASALLEYVMASTGA